MSDIDTAAIRAEYADYPGDFFAPVWQTIISLCDALDAAREDLAERAARADADIDDMGAVLARYVAAYGNARERARVGRHMWGVGLEILRREEGRHDATRRRAAVAEAKLAVFGDTP